MAKPEQVLLIEPPQELTFHGKSIREDRTRIISLTLLTHQATSEWVIIIFVQKLVTTLKRDHARWGLVGH